MQQPEESFDSLDKKKKTKKGQWDKVFNKRKLEKPEKVAVLYLRTNGSASGFEVDAKKGFFVVNDRTYHIARDCIYNLGKDRVPLAIIEEDGLKPLGTADYYKRLKDVKNLEYINAEFQEYVIRAIRHAELVKSESREGTKINPKVAIGIIIALIIGFAIFRSYSG